MAPDMTGGFNLAGKRVYVAGHRGMVGSALVWRLAYELFTVLTALRAGFLRVDDPADACVCLLKASSDVGHVKEGFT